MTHRKLILNSPRVKNESCFAAPQPVEQEKASNVREPLRREDFLSLHFKQTANLVQENVFRPTKCPTDDSESRHVLRRDLFPLYR